MEETIDMNKHNHKKTCIVQTSLHRTSTLSMTSNTTVSATADLLSKINIEDLLKKVNNGDNQPNDFAMAVLRAIVDNAEQEVVVLDEYIVCSCYYKLDASNLLMNSNMQFGSLLTHYQLQILFPSNSLRRAEKMGWCQMKLT